MRLVEEHLGSPGELAPQGSGVQVAAVDRGRAVQRPLPHRLRGRGLYPGPLWGELAWTPQVLLDQTHAGPATTVTALVDALQPAVAVTCTWRAMAGTIASTLSVVSPDAAAIADLALRGQGFSCEPFGSGVTCRRDSAGVVEEQTVSDGLWLASVETTWHPEQYAARLAAFVWS